MNGNLIVGIIGKLPLNEISSQKQFIIFHKEPE